MAGDRVEFVPIELGFIPLIAIVKLMWVLELDALLHTKERVVDRADHPARRLYATVGDQAHEAIATAVEVDRALVEG